MLLYAFYYKFLKMYSFLSKPYFCGAMSIQRVFFV